MSTETRLLVTAASGQLGRLTVEALLRRVPAGRVVATVRSPEKGAALTGLGVEVRIADYSLPETLETAFAGIGRVLLISSSELGQRATQHRNAIEAARRAGVGFIAYTSLLHADTSPLGLAAEHRETEAALQASGLAHAFLRNGWYTENYCASIPPALQHGVFLGSAGEGRIASAARADYAEAAAAVLASTESPAGRVYELAGDTGYTLAQFAAEVAKQSGKSVVYRNLPEAEFKAALVGAGLPEPVAALLSDSDGGAAKGALDDDSKTLSRLIGRPTTPWAETITAALKG